jgi:SAM-dependent methyltransferase
MQFHVSEADLPRLTSEIPHLHPWMHPFKFNDAIVTGHFKGLGLEGTCWTVDDPDYPQAAGLFADYMRGEPYYMMDRILEIVGDQRGEMTALDIACATGRYSFYLADQGLGSVRGVEIRPEQVEQTRLIHGCLPPETAARLTFEHDPTSADDPGFRDGESYDVVLSMGLLYHIPNPLQHIRNLARLTQKVLILKTLTQRKQPGYWQLVAEDPNWMTKSVQGVSWIPHFLEVERWLKEVGFKRVESLVPPNMGPIADAFALKKQGMPARLLDGYLRRAGIKPSIEAYAQPDQMRYGMHNPSYFTYIAYRS